MSIPKAPYGRVKMSKSLDRRLNEKVEQFKASRHILIITLLFSSVRACRGMRKPSVNCAMWTSKSFHALT